MTLSFEATALGSVIGWGGGGAQPIIQTMIVSTRV